MMDYPKLHESQKTIGFSKPLDIANNETIGVQVSGDSTSFTLEFYGSIDGVEYNLIPVNRYGDYSTTITSTTTKGTFEVEVGILRYFKTKISAIGNNSLTVTASVFNG